MSNRRESLTPRQLEIARLIASGRTNKQIAKELYISESTVKCHVRTIFKRLSVTDRWSAVEKLFGEAPPVCDRCPMASKTKYVVGELRRLGNELEGK